MMRRDVMLAAAAILAAPAAPVAAQQQRPRREVRLDPGLDFNALVAAAPAGVRLILAPGRYPGWSAEPRDGQTFEAAGEGAVLDGGEERLFAFHGRAADVQLIGLTVQHYDTMDPPNSDGRARQIAAIDVTRGRNWQLVDVTVQRIGGRGVSMSPGMHILRGRYVDNGHIGIGGRAAQAVIEGAEIARNNQRGYASHWESGGYKNVGGHMPGTMPVMRGAKLIGCHIHHNQGRAIWFDWDCFAAEVEDCVIHHNSNEGIAYEASAAGRFRNCLIGFNNTSRRRAPVVWSADLMLQNSHDCVVEGCTIVADRGCALSVAHHIRNPDSDPPQQWGYYTGPFDGMRNRIAGNTFVLLDDAIGLVLDASAPPGEREVKESNVWGPNRWLARPGAREQYLWLNDVWRDPLGTLEEHTDLTPFVPSQLRA
jgi:Right handed beta helix region